MVPIAVSCSKSQPGVWIVSEAYYAAEASPKCSYVDHSPGDMASPFTSLVSLLTVVDTPINVFDMNSFVMLHATHATCSNNCSLHQAANEVENDE